jgi:AraC family transcriptional regulator of adaptative response/methylated-DNA-[protein]-cysteine methyltransferase
MNDYERIARVIRHLDAHHIEQPDLNELAAVAGLSPFHFHRLFTTWAGVTPKDFLQCLTVEHAKTLLQRSESVLDAALDAGLSGPSRLHDLCVSLEAASPGDVKSGGAGLTIRYGCVESPFGRCLIGETSRGICHLSFDDSLRAHWPNARLQRADMTGLAARIFTASERRGLRAWVRGTAFQVRVWRALLRVPAGQVTTYRQLGAIIGQPAAARAVGTAVGHNPLAFLIPCHRVIRETGAVGGYRWDPLRKRAMIAWESARQSKTRPDIECRSALVM